MVDKIVAISRRTLIDTTMELLEKDEPTKELAKSNPLLALAFFTFAAKLTEKLFDEEEE